MDSFIQKMEQKKSKNIGENGHLQNDWSTNVKNKICELYFQLVRCDDHSVLEYQWRKILSSFIGNEKTQEFKSVIKMIPNTRDIVEGKGEQRLSFMLLYCLWDYYPDMARFIFEKFICMGEKHSFGSFKDIKYFCNYIKEKSGMNTHPFIEYILFITVSFLKTDEILYSKKQPISLLGKWFPRAKSKKFGWINKKFSQIYYASIMFTAKSSFQKQNASKKCERNLRLLLVKLNKYLDTIQIKMSGKDWSKINFNLVTGPTLRIYKKAFQNLDKTGKQRYYEDDRVNCANNLKIHLKNGVEGNLIVKGKRIDMYKLVKDAYFATTEEDISMVNAQWLDNSSINKNINHYIIPMCDTSYCMTYNDNIPMYNSIGFGIRISEKTHPAFRHRILSFNTTPTWFQLNKNMTFHQKVQTMNISNCGGNTNFYKALEMVLNICVVNEIPPQEVEKMSLAIFSGMQIDFVQESLNMATMMENIKLLYNEAGLKTKWKTPYKVPHILFWNLKNTKGFPNCVNEPNTTMLSGYSPVLLNTFVEKGLQKLKNITPYKILMGIFNKSRYDIFDEYISTHL